VGFADQVAEAERWFVAAVEQDRLGRAEAAHNLHGYGVAAVRRAVNAADAERLAGLVAAALTGRSPLSVPVNVAGAGPASGRNPRAGHQATAEQKRQAFARYEAVRDAHREAQTPPRVWAHLDVPAEIPLGNVCHWW
jgi:hypothetical protein